MSEPQRGTFPQFFEAELFWMRRSATSSILYVQCCVRLGLSAPGAINSLGTRITIEGDATFTNNSAVLDGGETSNPLLSTRLITAATDSTESFMLATETSLYDLSSLKLQTWKG